MLGIYGVPAALGAPANINVLTTYIFKLTAWSPPLYNTAAAVAILLMVGHGDPGVGAAEGAGRARASPPWPARRFRPAQPQSRPVALVHLRPGRRSTCSIVVVLPTLALIIAAFRKFLFFKDFDALFDMEPVQLRALQQRVRQSADHAVDLEHHEGRRDHGAWWAARWPSPSATRSTAPTSPAAARSTCWPTLPVAIPGLVVGVAYLWAWIGLPGGLYGTIWILALAFVARFMPDTVKALSTSFLQIHKELEEAAWICGRGMLGTIRTIVLPLAQPGVVASMTLLFVLAIRELGSSLFLYTSDTTVMAVLLLDYYEGGNTGKTAAFSSDADRRSSPCLLGITTWLSRDARRAAPASTDKTTTVEEETR